MTPVEPPVPTDQVYAQLRRLIIEGRYPAGARLVEERLASELGVSRTPVRQALARAAAEGLVELFPHRGAVVRSFSAADLLEIYDLRAALESLAAGRAAAHITQQQLATLEQAALALEQAISRSFASREEEIHYLVQQNALFHDTIIVACGNRRLSRTLATVVDVPLQFRSFNWYSAEHRRISNFFHRGILHALRRADAERARALMQEHIYHGRDALLQSLGSDLVTADRVERTGMTDAIQ